ncbi:hypothetical protein [Parafilimonas sp.]|uniref:hypothetical protein n=1 Tax=Parafilimonas sp. TaxID=1969739 RepID=UPI0039E43570
MKTISIAVLALIFLSACHQIKLDKEEAAAIIRKEKGYPKVYDYGVNMTDPESARKLLNAGLENAGIVTIDRTQKLKDIGKPIVHFTDKAKPYLLHIDETYNNVEVVKLADEDLGEITGIKLLENKKTATVEYTVVYKNITPFSKLIQRDLTKPQTEQATLSYFDTGWKLDRNMH